MYSHTQFGTVTAVSLGLATVIAGVATTMAYHWVGVAVTAAMLLAFLMFATLTVQVNREWIRLRFGIGLIRKSFKVDDIESVEPVRNSWLYGWGIRYTPHGWLYNVSGLDAVEIRFKSGKKARIGSDEPKRLAAAIRNALAA